jgi:hypothetical protein
VSQLDDILEVWIVGTLRSQGQLSINKRELKLRIKDMMLELIENDWNDIYSSADTPREAVSQAKANYKAQLRKKVEEL